MPIFGKSTKFDAALNVLIAEYTYGRLSDEQRVTVDKFADQVMRRAGYGGHEALALFAMPRDLQFAVYALAMKELGIKPAIPGEGWRRLGNPFSEDAEDEEAQEQAYQYLIQKHGIDIYSDDEDGNDIIDDVDEPSPKPSFTVTGNMPDVTQRQPTRAFRANGYLVLF